MELHGGEKVDEQTQLLTVLFLKHIDIDTCFASLFCYILFTINDGQLTALDSQALDTNCVSNNAITYFLCVAKG